MKASKIAYKTLDAIYSATESTDRANRGVTFTGWTIAIAFSVVVWAGLARIIFG